MASMSVFRGRVAFDSELVNLHTRADPVTKYVDAEILCIKTVAQKFR